MRIHADFTERVVVDTSTTEWVASPMPGVERKMLDRVGGERARATSLVRYAPGSRFSEHVHHGGEEFFVLEGVFSDEHGRYPAGSYVRNPIGSRHTPYSDGGCVILVKLWQFQPDDGARLVIDARTAGWRDSVRPGMKHMPLHRFGDERVSLLRFEPGMHIEEHLHELGEEFFVIDGELRDEFGRYPTGSWVRQPPGSSHRVSTDGGCVTWTKAGHLGFALQRWADGAAPA
jgi:anti-sigma factor ChrR (cupin superfamily)